MEELVAALVGVLIEKLKPLLVPVIVGVVSNILTRHKADPEFAGKLESAIAAVKNAKTEEERLDASKNLHNLVSS